MSRIFFFRTYRLLITEKKENKIDLVLCTIYVYISALAYNANPAYIGYTFVQRKKEKKQQLMIIIISDIIKPQHYNMLLRLYSQQIVYSYFTQTWNYLTIKRSK